MAAVPLNGMVRYKVLEILVVPKRWDILGVALYRYPVWL